MTIFNMAYIKSSWGGGWQPWANTIVYYNIDNNDTTTIYDKANSYNLTCNASYSTDANAGRCLSLTYNTWAWLWAYIDFWTTYTVNVWFNCTWSTSGWGSVLEEWWSSSQLPRFAMYVRNDPLYEFRTGSVNWNTTTTSTTWWHLYTFTRDTSWCVAYIDGIQKFTVSYSAVSYNSWSYFNLWWYVHDVWPTWLLKALIIENTKRTAQEISDYFNQTKSTYWIS